MRDALPDAVRHRGPLPRRDCRRRTRPRDGGHGGASDLRRHDAVTIDLHDPRSHPTRDRSSSDVVLGTPGTTAIVTRGGDDVGLRPSRQRLRVGRAPGGRRPRSGGRGLGLASAIRGRCPAPITVDLGVTASAAAPGSALTRSRDDRDRSVGVAHFAEPPRRRLARQRLLSAAAHVTDVAGQRRRRRRQLLRLERGRRALGGTGNDVIRGGEGATCVSAGLGTTTSIGGSQVDVLYGGPRQRPTRACYGVVGEPELPVRRGLATTGSSARVRELAGRGRRLRPRRLPPPRPAASDLRSRSTWL